MQVYPSSSYAVPRAYQQQAMDWSNNIPDPNYPMYTYPMPSNDFEYVTRSSHHSERRAPPPLDMGFTHGHDPNIRSPTASYPTNYNVQPVQSDSHHYYPAQDVGAGLSGGSYHVAHSRSYSPPPISPSSTEEQPLVKKKRRRADANQLRVLNATYDRTAFPTTEERLALAQELDMSARSVQIWFQNKRQAMKQTNRQSSSNGGDVHHYGSAPSPYSGPQRPSHSPGATHRRSRTQEDGSGRRASSRRP